MAAVVLGRHPNATPIQSGDVVSLCKPRQSCITSALTKASGGESPCPKCKETVRLHNVAAIGKGEGGLRAPALESED